MIDQSFYVLFGHPGCQSSLAERPEFCDLAWTSYVSKIRT